MITTYDLAMYLRNVDEITVLELLDISSEELVDRFGDFIEARYEYLQKELEEEIQDGSEESESLGVTKRTSDEEALPELNPDGGSRDGD